jgi:hypothetical protein
MRRLLHVRHWLLLLCFGISLYIATRVRLLSDLSVAFACYGALHALALALALRPRAVIWRSVLFIIIAAALSVMTLRIGLIGMQWMGTLPGNVALYVMLGVSAMISAASYGFLIRLYCIPELPGRAIAVICIACIFATYAGFMVLAHTHSFGRWLLAVFWWYAFSGALWYCGRGPKPAMRTAA